MHFTIYRELVQRTSKGTNIANQYTEPAQGASKENQ